MDSAPTSDLIRRARRAYELGRLRVACRVLVLVAAVTVMTGVVGGPRRAAVLAGLLSVVGVGLRWWGGPAGRGVVPGIVGGSTVMLALVMLRDYGVACETTPSYGVMCVGAGLGAGAILWRSLPRESNELAPSAVWAASIAGATTALGCAPFGLGASLGVAAAVVIGGIGVTVLAPR